MEKVGLVLYRDSDDEVVTYVFTENGFKKIITAYKDIQEVDEDFGDIIQQMIDDETSESSVLHSVWGQTYSLDEVDWPAYQIIGILVMPIL